MQVTVNPEGKEGNRKKKRKKKRETGKESNRHKPQQLYHLTGLTNPWS